MALVLMIAEEILGSTFVKNTVLIYLISIIFILQKDFFYWSKLIYNVELVSGVPQNESFVAQLVKNPPAMWETWVRSLGWKDPLEKGKATYSSILAWRIQWTV